MTSRWGRGAAVLTVGVLALAGCNGGGEEAKSPSPTGTTSASSPSASASSSPSASASPSSSTASAVPSEAKQRTEDGAIAFLEFYFDQVNEGYQNPATPPDLFAYADKACVACKNALAGIAEYKSGGWSVQSNLLEMSEAKLATAVTEPKVIVNFTLSEQKVALYENGEPTDQTTDAASGKRAAALRWVNDSWQLFDIEKL